MLSGTLPISSRGLGNVAGDQLNSASDIGVPVIGVGLLAHGHSWPWPAELVEHCENKGKDS
jgi:hypothetical protein